VKIEKDWSFFFQSIKFVSLRLVEEIVELSEANMDVYNEGPSVYVGCFKSMAKTKRLVFEL